MHVQASFLLFVLAPLSLPTALVMAQEAAAPPIEDRAPRPSVTTAAPDCIPVTAIRSNRVVDDRTIDFTLKSGRILRNALPYACPQLAFEGQFAYARRGGRLCSTDIVTVLVSPGMSRGASCGLGPFREITPATSEGR